MICKTIWKKTSAHIKSLQIQNRVCALLFFVLFIALGIKLIYICLEIFPNLAIYVIQEPDVYSLFASFIICYSLLMVSEFFAIVGFLELTEFSDIIGIQGIGLLILSMIGMSNSELAMIVAVFGIFITISFILIDYIMIRIYERIRRIVDVYGKDKYIELNYR